MYKFGNVGVVGTSLFALAMVIVAPASAINIRIDYSYDSNDFFGASNPQGATGGAQAKAAVEAAATFFSNILQDSFSSISAPATFNGEQGGQAKYFWKRRFFDPSTGANRAEINPTINANEYVIFVGARDLPGGELGNGGPGGYVGGFAARSGSFTSAEGSQITATAAQFASESTVRGETSGFGRWGGSLSFDLPTNWHYNHTTNPGAGQHDFYTIALHELAHALGFGEVDSNDSAKTAWENLVNGTGFTGANALIAHTPSGSVPLASADDTSHWLQSIADSPIYQGSGTQKPIMVPSIGPGIRRRLTNLDAAALADIGWQIDLPGGSASATTFASFSGSSGSASYAAMSASIAPEPGSACLAIAAASAMLLLNPRRRIR